MTNIVNNGNTNGPISEPHKVISAQREDADRVITPFAAHLADDSDPVPSSGKSRVRPQVKDTATPLVPRPAPGRPQIQGPNPAPARNPSNTDTSGPLPSLQRRPDLDDANPSQSRVVPKENRTDTSRPSSRTTPDSTPVRAFQDSSSSVPVARRIQDSGSTSVPLARRIQDNPTDPVTPPLAVGIENPTSPLMPKADPDIQEDWQQKLQMLLLGGSPELFMQQSPALALLSGHLEYVEPAQIPAIVAQSPLLQGILSTAKTADALQTAMPLEQNLKILGLIPEQTPTAALGLEPLSQQPLVKIADTLKALGFDPSRIMQEGDLLKDNISLDGLQSYMQRADRLRASLGLPLTLQPQDPGASSGLSSRSAQTPLISSTKRANGLDSELSAKLSRLAPQNSKNLSAVQLWSQIPERPELMPLTLMNDGSDIPVFPTPMDPQENADTWDPFASIAPDRTPDPVQPAPTMDNVPLVMNVLPRAPAAAQDPFLALTQRWNPLTVQTLRPDDIAAQDSRDITNVQQPLRSLDDLLHRHLIQPPELNTRLDAGPLPARENTPFDISTLQFSIQDMSPSSDNSNSGPSDQNSDSSTFMNQDANSFFTPSASPTFGSQKSFTIETAAPQASHSPVNPQHMQEIFDKSSMLIKDGGGSIRVDLGSREMGPLDLALDINGKNVELRIVTHSNQAREALVQELPRLRESLHNQHLNLDKVEIGLSYNSSFSQQSGSNPQNRDQFFENTRESSSRGPEGIRSTRSYRQSLVSGPEPRVPLHNGLIQVRV